MGLAIYNISLNLVISEHKLAIFLTYESKSGQLFFGPRNVKEKIKKSYHSNCQCKSDAQNDESWEHAFNEDNLALIAGSHEMDLTGMILNKFTF